MKSYVIREWTGTFKECVITTDKSKEVIALQIGIELLIESRKESIEFYKSLLNGADNDKDKKDYNDRLVEHEEYLSMLKGIAKNLAVDNEIPITKYKVTNEKVDYTFNYDITKLNDTEILDILNKIFPDKDFYLLPNFRSRSGCRTTVLGHGGNIVIRYQK